MRQHPLAPYALASIFAIAFALVVAGESAPASVRPLCDRVAAPGGSDGWSGTKRRPFGTVQQLASSLRPGETGCLRRGTYERSSTPYVLKVERGGASQAPIVIRSFPGERAKLAGIVVVDADHVVLSRLTIEGPGVQNTVKIYGADVTVKNSEITNDLRGSSCVTLGNASFQAVRPVLRRNRIHDCGSNAVDYNHHHGVYVANAVGGHIVGNVIWSVAAKAIQLYPNAQKMRVAHNIVDGGRPSIRGSVIIGGNTELASSDNVVERNVIAYARTHNIESYWEAAIGSGNIARHNCVWGGVKGNIGPEVGFTANGNVVAEPQFVNREQRDYRLQPQSRCRAVLRWN
jgi:Right handed beta helix region